MFVGSAPYFRHRLPVSMAHDVVQAADDGDLVLALEAVHAHRLPFWDAMLWASAQRSGVRHILSEDFQDGFELQDVTFINPFNPENNQLIDNLLPQS